MFAKSAPARAGPRSHAYTLVEELANGSELRDLFTAPSDAEAIARVEDVIEYGKAELWRGKRLIHSWGHDHDAVAPIRLRA